VELDGNDWAGLSRATSFVPLFDRASVDRGCDKLCFDSGVGKYFSTVTYGEDFKFDPSEIEGETWW